MRSSSVVVLGSSFACALAALLSAGDASAYWSIYKPKTSIVQGQFSKSTYSGASDHVGAEALEFGGGYGVMSTVMALDHDRRCATSDPEKMCSSYVYFGKAQCLEAAKKIQQQNCAQKGFSLHASHSVGADITLFGKDVSLYSLYGNAMSSSTGAAQSAWALSLLGYQVAGATLAGPQSGLYVLPDYGLDLIGKNLVAVQGFLFNVSVSASGQLSVNRNLLAMPGGQSLMVAVSPGGALFGNVTAGPGASSYTVGVQGTMKILSVNVPMTATLQKSSNTAVSYMFGRQIAIGVGGGNLSFGVFGPGIPSNYKVPIVSWNGVTATYPYEHVSSVATF